MKKIISLLLVVCMMLTVLPGIFQTSAVTHGYQRCDADDDGDISSKDLLLVRKYMAGLVDGKSINTLAADANEDGDIDSKDILYIKKVMAGIIDLDENNTDGAYDVNSVTVGGKNIARYTIVIPASPDECVSYSAKRLKSYIKDACGVSLNIANEGSMVEGYAIRYVYDTDNLYELGKEGYKVSVGEDGDITLFCGSARGPLYVTYYFLEEFIGYRFLLDDVEYLYKADNVDIPLGFEDTEVPTLTYRAVAQGGCTTSNFASLRANAVDGEGSRACTKAQYGWGLGTLYIHAHSYCMQIPEISNSEGQPCLTSEDTYNRIVEYNLALLAERASWGQYLGQHYTQISCSPNDNTGFCNCTKCKAVYAEEGSISGTVFRLANRVAERIEKDYPGIEIFTIAYWDARNPPKITRPRDNICVCFCFGGCNNHTYDHPEECVAAGGNPRPMAKNWAGETLVHNNADEMDYYTKWAELTNNIYAWYYSANFSYYMAPSPNLFSIYNDFKYIASSGATGIYSEGSSTPYYSFEYLRGYMVSKMMWDPFMSEEEFNDLFNEYLMIYYGDGWRYIREYIEMSNYASDINGCWTNNFDRPWNMYNKEYFKNNYAKMSELFDKAYSEAQDDIRKHRIAICRLHCDFLGLSATYERDWVNGSSESKAAYLEHYQYLYDTILKYGIEVTSFGSGKGGCNNYPSSRNDVRDTMSWISNDFSGYWEFVGGRWI